MTTLLQNNSSLITPLCDLVAVPRASGGAAVNGADFGDVEVTSITGAAAWNDWLVSSGPGQTIENFTPTLVDIDNLPLASRIAGASAEIQVSNSLGVKRRFALDFSYAASGNSDSPRGYVSDSVTDFCWSLIEAQLVEPVDLPLFGTHNHATQSYPLNAGCWAAGWDFSGVSVWNSRSGGFERAATAVTRRHLWMAWHYRLQAGDTVRFRRPNGTVDTHTVLAVNPGSNFSATIPYHENTSVVDMCIVLLDRNLHEDIAVYPLAGDWLTKFASIPESVPDYVNPGYGFNVWQGSTAHPCGGLIRLNKRREVSICPVAATSLYAVATAKAQSYSSESIPIWPYEFRLFGELPAFLSGFQDWFQPIESGDSSSPVFSPLSSASLCVVTNLSTTTGGMQPNATVLNAMIAATDANAGVSTELTVTVAPDPTL